MDLWWPPGVPYIRDGAPRNPPAASSGDAASLALHASDPSLSEIYTCTLGPDRFRLIYLSAASTPDSPIHVHLVDYGLDDCPEYETASYTWGGEDGDATPCKPAYFGDFWDVLFITRNCSSLLQYLRSQMVTRIVWVDAICINQNNIQERGAQVSLMPEIYGNCMRVVVYPGEHIVHRDERNFRERIRHTGAPGKRSMSPEMWTKVMETEYVRRVWIIQELILAPSAILAVENCDIYIDHNLLSPSYYSDPPDKPPSHINPTQGREWLQYDCIIGVTGHTLLVSKAFWPLFFARNSNKALRYPSWVPSLDIVASEADEHFIYNIEPEVIEEVPGKWAMAVGLQQLKDYQASSIVDDYYHVDYDNWFKDSQLQIDWVGSRLPWYQDASIGSDSGALTLRLVRLFDTPHRIMGPSNRFRVGGPSTAACFTCTKTPQELAQPCHMFLAFRAWVFAEGEVTTAQYSRRPTSDICLLLATEAKASGMFELMLMHCDRLDDAALFSKSPMTTLPPPLLPRDSSYGRSALSLYEMLYETLNYEHRKQYLLPRRDSRTFFESSVPEVMLFNQIVPGSGLIDMFQLPPCVLQLALAAARTGEPTTVTEDFRQAYAACLQFVPAEFNPILDDEYVWFKLVDSDDLEHFWDGLIEYSSWTNMSERDYNCNKSWLPWDILFPPWFDLQIPDIGKGHWNGQRDSSCCTRHEDNEDGGNRGLHYWLPCAAEPTELQMPVRAKMPLKEIVEAIREMRLCWLYRCLVAFGEKVSEDVETLLERGPQPEASNMYLQEWPKALVEELGFVWQHEMVTFV
ncbi:hypothetical protein INS49_004542 [Diaporthe citri]|uniref:uncharacterized protein n=1 Tax=Diaporthe citri TaxID=83186 RepID=UPI001C80DBC4|nr:uncharacterized protein INS49_004542 [Diaporthe citri]KAG6354525.1 hypothetical protein INS49_004542 [Diaporthe citri]